MTTQQAQHTPYDARILTLETTPALTPNQRLELSEFRHRRNGWLVGAQASAGLLAALEKIADQAHRATLVQDRSVWVIKQACKVIALEAQNAIAAATGGQP